MKIVKAVWNGVKIPPLAAEAEVSFSEGKVTLTYPTPSALMVGENQAARLGRYTPSLLKLQKEIPCM
ncbi:hypothetical protein [Algoriphagus ornithinivorans]|uniref:hypothetical protein n=1 Tax=Algoriphagus ornithinivorans TaxID=226506 RepID=UPI000B84A1A7|nr:hypothetical protein [Algoriphagus ornithinivorans]